MSWLLSRLSEGSEKYLDIKKKKNNQNYAQRQGRVFVVVLFRSESLNNWRQSFLNQRLHFSHGKVPDCRSRGVEDMWEVVKKHATRRDYLCH